MGKRRVADSSDSESESEEFEDIQSATATELLTQNPPDVRERTEKAKNRKLPVKWRKAQALLNHKAQLRMAVRRGRVAAAAAFQAGPLVLSRVPADVAGLEMRGKEALKRLVAWFTGEFAVVEREGKSGRRRDMVDVVRCVEKRRGWGTLRGWRRLFPVSRGGK